MRVVENRVLESGTRVERALTEDTEATRKVLARAALLLPEDRAMVELALRGVTHRQIASLLKLDPGNVSRRLKRLARRLHDPLVLALLDEKCPLDPEVRQLAVEKLLVGLGETQLAAKHGLAPAEVKKRLGFVNGWHQAMRSKGDHLRSVAVSTGSGSSLSGRKVTRNQLRPSESASG